MKKFRKIVKYFFLGILRFNLSSKIQKKNCTLAYSSYINVIKYYMYIITIYN